MEQNETSMNERVKIEYSEFTGSKGIREYQLMIHALSKEELFEKQLLDILDAYEEWCSNHGVQRVIPVFMRFFLSDSANQYEILNSRIAGKMGCAVSIVQQPPLDGSKIALWVYLQSDVAVKELSSGLFEVSHGSYRHYWSGTAHSAVGDSEEQMTLLFNEYVTKLEAEGCTLADNCIRTWLFVQNVDVNYGGVVKARNEVFARENLTSHTHFIASTGINGRYADSKVCVLMDTYGSKGLQKQQINYLYAKSHLNPTYEYGVSFERGTYVDYGDRRHVFISGTASINNKGEVMYLGDIKRQSGRMLENVEALLKEADCNFDDVQQIIVYLRDVTDYSFVHKLFSARFPGKPKVIVHAPVCRPGWLIEMECIAMKAVETSYPEF